MRDLKSSVEEVHVMHVRVSDNTAQVGAIIDHQGAGGLYYSIHAGSLADADATFAVLLEDGAQSDMSDAATYATTSFTFAADNTIRLMGYVGNKRYSRVTITPSGNAGAADISVRAVRGMLSLSPPA